MIEPSTQLRLKLSKFVKNRVPTPKIVTIEIDAGYIQYILSCQHGKNVYAARTHPRRYCRSMQHPKLDRCDQDLIQNCIPLTSSLSSAIRLP